MRSQFRLVVASTLALLIGMGAMPAASGDEPGTGATATPLPGSSTTGVPSQGSSSGTDQADTGGADGRSAGSGVATGDGAASVAVAEDAGPAEYMYDAAGRLVAVVSDETGEVAEYSYDATGNITGVERRPDSELSVLSVVPLTASTGDEVVVRGTGFTSGLAVTVGGEAVTVQDVTATSASFLVPDGASGGRVAVTVGGDSASGPGLTVMEGPSITQISPLSGLPGTEVEITGSGFAAEAQDNVVSIGGQLAEVVSVTPTTVRAVVPVSAGFGKVKVRTPAGDAASDDEFLVSIEGVDISAIESVQRVEVGGDPIDVRVTEAGNAALVVFDMPEGRHVDLGITGATFSGYTDYGYVGPDGQERMHFLSNGEALRQVTGAAGRTYGLIVEPEDAGQVTVTLSEPVGGDLATTGASTVVALERPGQTARTTIDLSAGDDLTLTASEASIGYRYIEVFGPDGESVDSAFGSGTSQVFNVDAIQEAGTYTVQVRPTTPSTGSVVLTASLSRDAGELSLTGASTEFVVGRAGQEVFGTLELSVGDELTLASSGVSVGTRYVEVFGPDGERVDSAFSSSSSDVFNVDPVPVSGTYRVVVRPTSPATGSATLTASLPADVGGLSLTGASTEFVVGRAGQEVAGTVDLSAGDRLTVASSGVSVGTRYVEVFGPDGERLDSAFSSGSTHVFNVDPIPAAGTYTIVVRPTSTATGSATVTVSLRDDAGALVLDGAATEFVVGRAGQEVAGTLDLSAGQDVALSWTVENLGNRYVELFDPDGTRLASRFTSGASGSLSEAAVPVSGTYTVLVRPMTPSTGTVSVSATEPADALVQRGVTRASVKDARPEPELEDADDSSTSALPEGVKPQWTPDAANLQGVDWVTRRDEADVPRNLRAARGTTAVAGHVLDLKGKPLAGVTVTAGDVSTRSDKKGRFLLEDVSAAAPMIVVDGSSANTNKAAYGTFRIQVEVEPGTTTQLPATVWMPRLDTEHTVELEVPTTTETVLTSPYIPGLEVRLPAGTVVRDADGNVVRELGITPLPLDRAPFPMPRYGDIPLYFTVQPGGTFVFPEGAQIVYPNYTGLAPGERVEFFDYEPEGEGWRKYGHGTVSEDGTQVVPDEDTRVWSFDGSSFNWSGSEKPGQSRFSDFFDWLSGDPVDLSTGLLTDTRTDLAVDDGIAPIAVERSYWQGDQASREFGIGQHLNYGMWLHSEEYWQEVDLYLPGGGKVHYVRTTPGNSLNETEMEAVDTTGPFRSSTISYVQGGWDLVTLDGLTYHFPHVSRATSITDRNGNEVRLTRDGGTGGGPGNDLTQITSPTGRWIKLEYDAEHRITSARDNIGRTVTYTYDEAGHLSTVTDPAGNVSTYTYDTEGRIDSITDARGITYLSNEYDANGRVSRQTLTDGQVFEFEYTLTADGTVSETRVTRPDGSVREVSFDADGVAMSDTILSGSGTERTTTFTRRADNLVTEVVDPYGRVSRHSYDERGLLESTSVLSGTADEADLGTTTYGAYTLPVEHTDPAGNVTRMRYDDRGNLVETIDPEGRSRTATYNARGQVTSVTDASGNTSEFGYVAGDLVSVTGPDGATTRMFTDAVGRRTVTEAPDGAIRTMELDELNQPVRLTDPLGFEQSYTYDPNGNVTGFTDAAGRVTSWTYDDSDRVVARTDASGASDTFAYDAAGRISETTSRAGRSVSYGYDGLGRVISEEYASGGQFASAVTYAYDEFDRPASVTDSEIGTTSYTYDVRDRVVGVDEPAGSTTFEYDANSRVVSATMAGQQARTYTYDATGALTGIDQGGTSVGLDLDAAGRLSQVSLPGGWTQSYTYDTGDRVTALTYAHGGQVQGDLAYTYLPDGKVGSVAGSYANVTLPAERSALEYDVLNRLTSAGGVPLEYDQDGNMLTDGSRTFQWDARGRLAGVAGATVATEFGYDPTGGRAARTNDGDRTGFLDLGPNTAVELDADGEVAAELLSGGMDQWFARIHEGGTDAILTDLLGSPLALGAADGTTSARYSYDPFGVTTTTGDTHGADLGFTGRQDDGTGLTYHRARYYHPELGRFISEDPIGLAGGTNLYAYAANAPTSYTDPTGTNPLLLACAGGALVDGGISYLGQRLSGRKVQWGDVGAAAATGCVGGMLLGPIGGRAIQAGRIGTAARPAANGAARGADDILDGAGALCRRPNSFDAGTLVLMADGSRKPIEDVEVGDLVLASDPVTGEQGARRVTDLIRHGGVHTMVDVGFADGGQVDATDEHPFWVVSEDAWVDAIDLEAGDLVLTAEGSTLRVTSVDVSRYDVTAYNLTIADLHTYHVTADDVLVHNAGDDSPVGEVFRDGAYRFQIFSNDHAPAHGHLQGPGIKGHGIQIGQNGKPLDPNIKLTSAQQKVIDNNLRTIRNSIRNYMKWYKQNPGC